MANKPLDTTILDNAIHFAVDAHHGTERRGKGFPYIVHPMEAVEIVATLTTDQELLAAAALHDVVEDTDVTVDEVRAKFGDRIASLVAAESDVVVTGVSEAESWRGRKQAAIDRLAAASHDAKIVALGDKLSNMRAIARDYAQLGDALWSRFHAPGGKADHEWHYRGLAISLIDLSGTPAYSEFTDLIARVFGDPKPELIDMSEYTQSGDGFTAISYNHRDGHRMMKLYAPFIPLQSTLHELKATWELRKMGLHVPNAYRLVTDGTRIGVEFERITPKKSFARAISDDPDNLEKYVVTFTEMCKKLHATPCDTGFFGPADAVYRKVVSESKDVTEEQRQRILAFLDTIPAATTCLHGDMHIGNAITNGEETWWIDLGDFRYGNPEFDLAMLNLACNCIDEEMTQRLYHISRAQMAEVWRIFVREYYGPDTDPEEIKRRAMPFTTLNLMKFSNQGVDDPLVKVLVEKTFGA